MTSEFCYGIDFGTTNTSVYLYHYEQGRGAGGTRCSNKPFSSCIAISKTNKNDFKYGCEVKENINTLADNYKIITSFKTLLGKDKKIAVNNEVYSGKELVYLFLSDVKEKVNAEKPRPDFPDFEEAIFSIPVDFSEKARTELKEAAEKAGIRVKGFVSESSAAYISKARDKDMKGFSKVMVIDFGGGTLDLSILNIDGSKIFEDFVDGVEFGGDDIDNELAQRLLPKVYPNISYKELDAAKKDKFMNEVERMKIEFSDYDDYTMTLGEGSRPYTIDYDTFSDIITPLITKNVLTFIIKVMDKAGVTAENIDAVILAGGSSGLRPFAEMVIDLFGRDKLFFDDEDSGYQWIVAKGAAITSAIGCDFRLSDDLCILLSDGKTYPILKKDENKAGDTTENIYFSLTADSFVANFIFTDSTGENRYATIPVKTKGYYNEMLELSVTIGEDQIARVTIKNENMGDYQVQREINKLRFYYDLKDLNDVEELPV